MAFSAKIVPNATVMSLSLALITGAIAAIALPPHIAVPPDTNVLVSIFTFNNLPIHNPSPIVNAIENIVNTNPVFPASIASVKFIPKPNPTTDACNNILVNILLCWINGLPTVNATINPDNNAVAGVKNGTKNNKITNIVSRVFCDNFSILLHIINKNAKIQKKTEKIHRK